MNAATLAACLLAISACCTVAHASNPELRILPAESTLTGPEAQQRLLVEQYQDGRPIGQMAGELSFESSDPNVVRIENGIAVAVGNGTATITVRVAEQTATAVVNVVKADEPQHWSFRNHVQSVLTKTGCNSGACHGAVAGKNGFKLSLRGYDPEFDYLSLTRQSRGRRIVPSDPARSLVLLKPTGAIPHKGGLRFDVESREYKAIVEWLAAGNPAPSADDPRISRLEVLPSDALLKRGATQQLIVRAHFNDGTVEDVTQWAKFTSANETVAEVDATGLVKVSGNGEGAIVAWYLANNVVATVTVPYEQSVPADVFTNASRNNFIDDHVLAKLQALNIPPSPAADDGVFLRRAYLDTIGVLPTSEEVRAYLENSSPDKRARLAEQLIGRAEFVDYWSYKWSDLLLVTGQRLRPEALKTYYKWIRERVAQNVPWDKFVEEILTARGNTFSNGAANYFALHQDPLDMSETASMAFLGMSIGCARCHDHPLEKWTNDQYYGMANLFARVRGKGWGGAFDSGDGNRDVFVVPTGELIQPRTGKPQPPRPLDGEAVAFESIADRREHLAKWMTSPDNPYFTRAIVNRVWANYFGVGIVENVDDLRQTNPASNEPLFAALADYVAGRNYDLKTLMRLILESETYRRSSDPVPGNEADERFYSRYYPRRLQAEVLLDAISQVTAVPTKFGEQPAGTRALQLADSSIESYFLQAFGRPERIITCECERTDEPSMVQVLHMVNGSTLNEKLATAGSKVEQLLSAGTSNEQLIEELYLTALSRRPTATEQAEILTVLNETSDADKRAALEDLFWGILSSREFVFQH